MSGHQIHHRDQTITGHHYQTGYLLLTFETRNVLWFTK